MKILHLSASDLYGGAARSAYRLHAGLRNAGVNSRMLVAQRASDDPEVRAFVPSRSFARRALRKLVRWREEWALAPYRATRPAGFEPFHTERSRFAWELGGALPEADAVHLHWISEFVDYAALLPRLACTGPLVWTLHDMHALTGGCHYDHGCNRYRERCGQCPQLGSGSERDLSRTVWERKQRIFARIPAESLHIVAPSRWLGDLAAASPLLARFQHSVIPYGLDTNTFRPSDQRAARARLGLPIEGRLILFVAHSSDIRRKGFDLLRGALAGLVGQPDTRLLTVGEGAPDDALPLPEIRLGRIEDDAELALVYAAADLFVIPSREDNLPNTVLESLACGTPVAGFAVGGIPEMVREGLTGALAAPEDVRGLTGAITRLLADDDQRRRMSLACRAVAEEEYPLHAQAERYRRLYAGLLADRMPSCHPLASTIPAVFSHLP
jgi:glycosyltransferase involved in cell wall biosynthesis